MIFETNQALPVATPKAAPRRKIPNFLVREEVEGLKFYYPGFRQVLNKTKTIEDIMPDSLFQSSLKNEIGDFLKAHLDKKQFRVLSGETGLHAGHGSNFGLEVVVYDKAVLTPEKINANYANLPAELVIEIDLNVELEDRRADLFYKFVVPKTKRLLSFGTKKVVWYFSAVQKILVAEPGKKWEFQDWSEPVELFPGLLLDILKLMEEADIPLNS
jgi:Uma2 family endonuclease